MPRQVMAPRTGLVAEKAGMTRIFMDDGRSIPVTVLQVPVATVVALAPASLPLLAWLVGSLSVRRTLHTLVP